MKQRLYGIRLLAVLLAALALSGPAKAGKQVPFKARSSGVATVESVLFPIPGGPPVITITGAGEGVGTHLGRFTTTSRVVIDVGANTVLGDWVLTAANGDQLFVSAVLFGIDPTHGGGFFTIEGGTGRFEGATGSFTQLITFASDPALGTTAYTDVFVGTISSPGSNQ